MNKSELIEIIKNIISEETEIEKDEISKDSLLMRDLELSSLEILTIMGTLEERLGIRAKMDDIQKITTINEMADYIINLL